MQIVQCCQPRCPTAKRGQRWPWSMPYIPSYMLMHNDMQNRHAQKHGLAERLQHNVCSPERSMYETRLLFMCKLQS